MIRLNDLLIIGIDHGYGNIKTANHIFKAGIVCYDHEPLFTGDMLVYDGRYYIIGEGHKEYINRKETDDDYYILMLAGIAMELESEGLTEAVITIAAGLPLTWTSGQKAEFAKYLTRNEEVSFTFRKVEYHIRILGARIYPQGYAAIAELAPSMKGVNVIADIGYGTVNTLFIVDGKPQVTKMFTEDFGVFKCMQAARAEYSNAHGKALDDSILEDIFISGSADIAKDDLKLIRNAANRYTDELFRRLREHGYDERTMMLYITGGGGCIVKNFYRFNKDRTVFIDDIKAAAKGYEYLAGLQMKVGESK